MLGKEGNEAGGLEPPLTLGEGCSYFYGFIAIIPCYPAHLGPGKEGVCTTTAPVTYNHLACCEEIEKSQYSSSVVSISPCNNES